MREVSYARQTLDSPNPITRFAHRSRYAVSLGLADELLPEGGEFLDFGAGEGTFLEMLRARRPDARLVAVEPYMQIRSPLIRQIAALADAAPSSVDVIGAFEVLEHVSDRDLADFLTTARTALRAGGKLLVTVPIMYGAVLPVKEVSRFLLHRRWSDMGAVDLAKATVGLPIARPENRLPTHIGFDFRWLGRQLAGGFRITAQSRSPFAALPWWLNSQAIFVAQPRN